MTQTTTQEFDICDSILANPQITLMLVDSAEAEERVIALELLSQLLGEIYVKDSRFETDNSSLSASACFAILTRCDDVSPAVRAKALTILAQIMKYLFEVLKNTKDHGNFQYEIPEDFGEMDLDVNGNHRIFWYCFLISYEEKRNELLAILHRRIEDSYVGVRKAALIALESLLLLDNSFISKDNLERMTFLLNDISSIVRKQLIESVTLLLKKYKENSQIQELWLMCVLPLADDTENSVQSKALLVLEDLFLQKLFSPDQAKSNFALSVLKKLSCGTFLAYDRFLTKAFSLWKSMHKLKTDTISKLLKFIGTDLEESVWFYLSYFVTYCPAPFDCLSECIEKIKMLQGAEKCHLYYEYIPQILIHSFRDLPLESIDALQSSIQRGLKTFSVPVELISWYSKLLQKIHRFKNTESEFAALVSKTIQECQENLLNIYTQQSMPPEISGLLSKYICTITEFCQLYPSYITSALISLLKNYSPCIEEPVSFSKALPLCVKAHAFIALGKLSLQDENLSTEILPAIVKQLLSKDDVIRTNASIILLDLCKRYTSYADNLVPLIVVYLKDKLPLIRYQTVVLLATLLRDKLVRWQVPLFFGMLSTLVDGQKVIREIAQYSLDHLMLEKKKNMFFNCLIDSIFVFNIFEPLNNEKIALNVKRFKIFSIPGENKRSKRMFIYKYLLESSHPKEKIYLIESVCEILKSVAESVYPLNKRTESVIKDCFAILMCDEIRIFNMNDYENLEESFKNDFSIVELKMRKLVISDSIIPAIIGLKSVIIDPNSDLMSDIIMLLKELLHDFKDDYKDILASDRVLLKQLELEFKNDVENERRVNSRKKVLLYRGQQIEANSIDSVAVHEIQNKMNNVGKFMQSENKTRKRKRKDASPLSSRLSKASHSASC